jgi:hypothetical protein
MRPVARVDMRKCIMELFVEPGLMTRFCGLPQSLISGPSMMPALDMGVVMRASQ